MMVGRSVLKLHGNVRDITQKNAKAVSAKMKNMATDENRVTQQKVAEKTKRMVGNSPKEAPARKRSAFGDITNAGNRLVPLGGKKKANDLKKTVQIEESKTGVGKRTRSQDKLQQVADIPEDVTYSAKDKSANSDSFENISLSSLMSDAEFGKIDSSVLPSSQELATSSANTSAEEIKLSDTLQECIAVTEPIVIPEEEKILPEDARNVDTDPDPFALSEYAESIFRNMKACEKMFQVRKYMDTKSQLTARMRAILIDWLVEVQENFELYHETLYLGVRIVDLYLQAKETDKQKLQLVGATAMLIAAKIEERYPPPLDDFVFICDDAYIANDFIKTEVDILRTLKFELGIPISYRFLRRYSRVAGAGMEVLTLARYILETSLLHYEFVVCSPSKIAAAALSLSFKMKKCCEWDSTLVYHTGYREDELKELAISLNKIISEPATAALQTVHSKYSHPVFFEVAKIPSIKIEE